MRRGTRSAVAAGAASTIVFGSVAAASVLAPLPHARAADCGGSQSLTSALADVLDPIELLTIRIDGDVSDSELAGLGYATVCTVDGVLEVVPLPEESAAPSPPPSLEPAPAPPPAPAPEQPQPETGPAPAPPTTSDEAASPSRSPEGEAADTTTGNRSAKAEQPAPEAADQGAAGRLVPAQLEEGNVGSAPARLDAPLSSERESRLLVGPELRGVAAVADSGLLGLIGAMSAISLIAGAAALLLRRRSNPRHLATARR